MAREKLTEAATHLHEASEGADGEAAERLADLAGQLETLAERERGPDHGRLARIQNALGELKDEVDAETVAAIEAASDAVSAYRETVEGV